MGVMIALVRGINVGGKSKLAMSDLRRVAEQECGFGDVSTYIQSGNVVFTTTLRSTDDAASTLQDALAATPGASPAVIVRTRAQFDDVIEANPFLADRNARGPTVDPNHLHVVFMSSTATIDLDDLDSYLPEAAVARGCEIYLHLPSGVGRSKLALALTKGRNASAKDGTMRNWRTVTNLAEMAAGLDRTR